MNELEQYLYYQKAIKKARNKGIVIGIGLAVFGPTVVKAITKKVAVKAITEALKESEDHSEGGHTRQSRWEDYLTDHLQGVNDMYPDLEKKENEVEDPGIALLCKQRFEEDE